jgi:molybdate transport system substrate-binding protein
MYPKLRQIVRNAVLGGTFAAFSATAHAADIKVLSDSPLQPALTKVAELFRQKTRNQVNLVFDPSPAVKKRIEDGEAADVVIVQPDFVDELARMGKVTAGDQPIIGRVGAGTRLGSGGTVCGGRRRSTWSR